MIRTLNGKSGNFIIKLNLFNYIYRCSTCCVLRIRVGEKGTARGVEQKTSDKPHHVVDWPADKT
jgi:hypothetical protein